MKKKVLLIAAIFTAGVTFAQDQMTSKKGTPILPEAGDYAIGFDAANFTSFAGNLLNGDANNSINNLGLANGGAIVTGKYFVDANKAYRGMLRLGLGSNTTTSLVSDVSSGAAANATVEDEVSTSATNITIGGGIEMRRGKGRLQGVYGPMLMFSLGGSSTENTYGNTLIDDFNANGTTSRVTETSAGSTFGLNLGGFAGVEYFFAPKISIGGEIAWTIAFSSTGAGETTTEDIDNSGSTPTVSSTTTETGTASSFSFDNRPMANLNLNFHF